LPAFLEREINFDGIKDDIVGATYGNGSHFIFRYVNGPEVFEADGMHRDSDGVRSALSVPTNEDYEISLPGELTNSSGRRGRNYRINDVYYRQRPADYVEDHGFKRTNMIITCVDGYGGVAVDEDLEG